MQKELKTDLIGNMSDIEIKAKWHINGNLRPLFLEAIKNAI